MTRGTTPVHTFWLPVEWEDVSELRIIYYQDSDVVLEKTQDDVEHDGRKVSVLLSQEDTLKFDEHFDLLIQLRVLTVSGKALASVPVRLTVRECFTDEVLGNEQGGE